MSETLSEFLNRRRQEMSATENRPYDEPIPWTELAERGGIPNTSLANWEKGRGIPRSFEDKVALAAVFGEQIYKIPGMEVDPDMAWVWNHRNHPRLKAELARMRRDLQPEINNNNRYQRSAATAPA